MLVRIWIVAGILEIQMVASDSTFCLISVTVGDIWSFSSVVQTLKNIYLRDDVFFYNNDVDSLTKKKERKHQLLCFHLGFIEDNKGILDVFICLCFFR